MNCWSALREQLGCGRLNRQEQSWCMTKVLKMKEAKAKNLF